ncbi:LLM class flavin-dependent oxidoreductase [Nocardia thailandica]|uniref:LLM class flavin-dependent oxidoreductase n=1 Tax=Nocardia thailandica TaxID=257275 RepID=A0ABW6PNE2_9NOCA
MTEFYWRLPTRGDGRRARPDLRRRGGFADGVAPLAATDPRRIDADGSGANGAGATAVTDVRPGRFGPFDDLAQIVHAAELTGFDGVLAPYDPLGEESWIVAGAALRATRYARIAVEFQPAFGTPVYAAKVSATLQRHSHGRLAWRLAVDTDDADARSRGDRVAGDDRYARAAEFLTVARGVWNESEVPAAGFAGTGFDYAGRYYDVIDGGFRGILSGLPFPEVHLSGTSPAALELSAAHGDLHLFAETPDGLDGPIAELRARAAAAGRTVRIGVEVPVIARETDAEARARVSRQHDELDPGGAARRDADLGDGRRSGFRALGHAQDIGLVGSYERVARRLAAYGADVVVLSGHPTIEEVHRAGEHLLHLADPVGRTLARAGESA